MIMPGLVLIRRTSPYTCSLGEHLKIEWKPVHLDVSIPTGVLRGRDLCHDHNRETKYRDLPVRCDYIRHRHGSIFLA